MLRLFPRGRVRGCFRVNRLIVFVATIGRRFSQADFIIPATRRARHEDGKFKAGLDYMV